VTKHIDNLTGILSDVEMVGGAVGFYPTALTDGKREAIERVLDEIFDRGYRAGWQDAKDDA
jgi:hypothetical protein